MEGQEAGTIAVTAFTARGDTVFSRRYPFQGVPIPGAAGDSVIRAQAEQLRRMSPALADAYEDAARVPDFHPPVVNARVGRDGSVWVQEPVRDELRPYLVIGASGEEVGRVYLPRSRPIAAAELGRIWVLERDENDVQSIVRLRLDWPSATPESASAPGG